MAGIADDLIPTFGFVKAQVKGIKDIQRWKAVQLNDSHESF
jgi:hypothetical protein